MMAIEHQGDELRPLQNAIFLLKQTQAKLAAYERARSEPIAIVGMGCRFPGEAEDPDGFWRMLRDGVDAIREVPPDRWDVDEYYDPDPSAPCKMSTRWGGFVERVDQFDADFFGISPREAVRVDPQHRLLLEVTWEALEDAGIAPREIAHTGTGVYVGTIGSDYTLLQSRDISDLDVFSGTGSSDAVLANRVSYVLDLNGPSIAVDTACSSSLVTVDMACQSLRRGEIGMALAGGVNLILSPEMTVALTKAYMMSLDGRCKAFDATADGYVRGEGCGMLVLKRFSDAQADGDRILALIRGTAVNHDGRSNGLSAPNGPAQEAVIRAALADAHLAPHQIGLIEAHGTGTRLGDPIEVEALVSALGAGRSRDNPLLLGSVKTNIGHLESAAGIAGLIKAVLTLRHGEIPPHLHLKNVNPLLKIDESPIEIPTELRPWPRGDEPRRAGVSSFGFGGTNAHIIVEEAPPQESPRNEVDRPRHVFTLSARSAEALSELATRHADAFDANPSISLADAAFTVNVGRTHFMHRAAVVAESAQQIRDKLRKFASDPDAVGVYRGAIEHEQDPRIAFLFTGQGAQYAGMGRALYETQPTFKNAMDQCAECLAPLLDRPLLELLDPDAGSLLDQTGYTQPVLFALEYALATLWRSWGIEPAAVMGHSVGEFAAACVAGIFSLEHGLRLIAERARLMQSLPPGGLMAAVFASQKHVESALQQHSDQVAIAALNGPENIVISGDEEAVREVLAEFKTKGIKSKTLATSHAFHSHLMDPILDELEAESQSVKYFAPKIDTIANLTGKPADRRTFADPSYWRRHARTPVRFAESMQALANLGCEIFLEIGPSPTLIGMGRRCLTDNGRVWLPSLRQGRDEWQSMLGSLAELYAHGAEVDWQGYDRDYERRRISLPTYPYQRRRYWAKNAVIVPPQGVSFARSSGDSIHPLLGRRLVAAVSDCVFESQISPNRPATLADHVLQDVIVVPGAAYLEMALAATEHLRGELWTIRGASFLQPLLLRDKTPKTLQTILTFEGAQAASFRVVSVNQADLDADPSFTTHAVGRLEAPSNEKGEPFDLEQQRENSPGEGYDDEWRAEALGKSGLVYGPTFCWCLTHWAHEGEALGQARQPNDVDRVEDYQVHPGLLDGGFQLAGAALPGAGTGIDAHVPMAVDRLRLHGRAANPGWYLAKLTRIEATYAMADIQLIDADGGLSIEIEGLRLQRVPRDWMARMVAEPPPAWTYELGWVKQSLDVASSEDATVQASRWLVFDTQDTIGTAVAERLEMKGDQCEIVTGSDPESRRASVGQFLEDGEVPCRGVIYLSGLKTHGQQADGKPDFEAARRDGWGGVLDVIHAVSESGVAKPPRLWLVTRGAQAVGEDLQPLTLAEAPLWGLGRVIATEHPELSCTRIDLDPADGRQEADQLVEEIWSSQREDQVAYRGSDRLVARLRRVHHAGAGELEVPYGQPYRLEITSRGQLDSVALEPATRPEPGPGQIEIKVHATGLNFRDVLNVLDLYPGDPGPLGGECAGEVVAVGEGVEHLKPGDAVVALAPASFATYAITLAEFAVPKPENLSFAEAATVPICFLTVQYALRTLGKMQPGERLLIHSASGGVGMAAIQVARQVGAEIFATAGSPRKREYLQSLGIEHVMDSRSVDFADQIMEATDGEGIDLVLNSLVGETIEKSLSTLRDGGRFLELGKTDLWDQERVDQFKPGLTFHAIALDQMMAEQAQTAGQLMREVIPQFAEEKLVPPPLETFPIQRVVESLRHMARAEHIGKVIIEAADESALDEGRFSARKDGTYLITGGLGGLGLKVAAWLAENGAGCLVLLGRSEPSEEALEQLKALEDNEVRVEVRQCDISDCEQVAALIEEVDANLPPLKGVFHLAGILDDGILREQTRERFDRVMAAKVMGAWNLHELTRDHPLDLFVLFSSVASVMGSPGQGNYAAANAFLDALALHRRARELPALSVNWGSWAEVGMAARLIETEGKRWSAAGIGWIEPARGLESLEQLIAEDLANVGIFQVDWPKFFARIPAGGEPPWLFEMAEEARAAAAESGPPVLLEKLEELTPAERHEAALEYIRKQAARVLALEDTELPDPRRPLNELGFDSLTAVEFCNRVGRSVAQHINPTLLFDYPTLESLTGYVLRDLLQMDLGDDQDEAPSEDEQAVDEVREQTMAEVEGMSEEDMDALVAEQLENLQQ